MQPFPSFQSLPLVEVTKWVSLIHLGSASSSQKRNKTSRWGFRCGGLALGVDHGCVIRGGVGGSSTGLDPL
ncbi:hypothetical protein VNO78_03406 [Psophocarpus tetragonolobus]|uniref:Uncharacterized protein n=1 Tax=Psophocarpus tetragonolobus TaxID=3891 RepID=A0AAN9XVX1_PSOTE